MHTSGSSYLGAILRLRYPWLRAGSYNWQQLLCHRTRTYWNEATVLSAQSQRYLEHLRQQTLALERGRRIEQPELGVSIIGAGICGLATALSLRQAGHAVTVFEAKAGLENLGAGLQLAPNATRYLYDWGLGGYLDRVSVHPQSLITKRWQDGSAIGVFSMNEFQNETSSRFIQVHRGDLHEGLAQLASLRGISVRFNSKVVQCDHMTGELMLETGEAVSSDMVIAAEGEQASSTQGSLYNATDQQGASGVHSLVRQSLDKEQTNAEVKFVAYRASIPTAALAEDEELARIARSPDQLCWAGPGKHCVAYAMKANAVYNMVFVVPASASRSGGSAKSDLLALFENWDHLLVKLITLLSPKDIFQWPIRLTDHADLWYQSGGKVIVLGDAVHDMTPFLGQGAAAGIEDAACIGRLLSAVRTWDGRQKVADIGSAFEILHAIRSPRVATIRRQAEEVLRLRHLADGEAQRRRDRLASNELTGQIPSRTPWIFANPTGQRWLYSYDVLEEINKLNYMQIEAWDGRWSFEYGPFQTQYDAAA